MVEEKLTIYNIADWFLVHETMTHKKLQKMLYLSYGYYLASYNENKDNITDELFENDFEAWVHGPVSPTIYNVYREAGYNSISKTKVSPCIISDKASKILYAVLEKYKKNDGDDLESLTHTQKPWLNARGELDTIEPCSNRITTEDIFEYFKENGLVIK